MENLIFETIHGSHLYNLAHEGSDRDMYYVFSDSRRARQSVHGDDDVVRVGWDDFLDKALSGSHQSLEALFSPVKVWHDERYRPYIENIIVPAGPVRGKYMRTIKKFAYSDFKRRRHALRLALNLQELTVHGRFNPQLDPMTADIISTIADAYEGDRLYDYAVGCTEIYKEETL